MDWNTASLAVLYQIQIDDYPSFSSPVRDYTTPSTAYTPSALGDGTYYWRVRARDSIGNWGPWCAAWHFTIDSIPPGTPVLVSPTSTIYTNDNTLLLDWNSVTGGYLYQIQVDTSFLFSSPIIDSTASITNYITYPLSDGAYRW
ncbi:unnamed protein product [marine sediment metagenome]|uniref:Fibronectin type-III domain-containing protein n=1 Tax=marine sediment metagenome TaxID=412755 RepID=X1G848_9ZZZZ